MAIIKIEGLTKDYGNKRGIFDLDFEIERGEVFGFLGPNGAGKTTTIRHLLGFLNADKGSCSILDMNCRTMQDQIQPYLGYLPGEMQFFDEMSGLEFLRYMAKLRELKDLSRMQELIKYFELATDVRIKKMSKGMKQKVGIIAAFMHNPQILILDEPTSGLDPLMQRKFIELIMKEKTFGKTILMSSHSFDEVEKTCDRVGIIKDGRFVTVSSVETLKASQRIIYQVVFESASDIDLFKNSRFEIININQKYVDVLISGNLNMFISELSKYSILSLKVINQNLEEIFMAYYGGNGND